MSMPSGAMPEDNRKLLNCSMGIQFWQECQQGMGTACKNKVNGDHGVDAATKMGCWRRKFEVLGD